MSEKQFIGSVFSGKFHEAKNVDLSFIIDRNSLKTLVDLMKAAKDAEKAGNDLPPGTANHAKYGRQVKLRIRTSMSGKPYCEIDTWQPQLQAETVTAEPVNTPPNEDDLFF